MPEKIIAFGEKILEFIEKLPLTDLLVGVIVPIMAAWISYYLAERAIRKKENSRLYIQTGLIKKELESNDKEVMSYISFVQEKEMAEKSLEFPLVFMKNFLIHILDGLYAIKQNYMHSGEFVFEKPTQTYILAQQLEDIESKITEIEYNGYSDEYLDAKRKEKLSKLMEEKEEYIKQIKDRDIYKEFVCLQSTLERLMVGDVFGKLNEAEDNFVLAKYIFDRIKEFNQKENKTKDDVLELYDDLILFNIDDDIIKDGCFDQEQFDLYYKAFERPEGIEKKLYELYEQYYKWLALKETIKQYVFNFQSKRWDEISADYVIINDRELYISLVEHYEMLENPIAQEEESRFKFCVALHERIQSIMEKIAQHELKLSKKCK